MIFRSSVMLCIPLAFMTFGFATKVPLDGGVKVADTCHKEFVLLHTRKAGFVYPHGGYRVSNVRGRAFRSPFAAGSPTHQMTSIGGRVLTLISERGAFSSIDDGATWKMLESFPPGDAADDHAAHRTREAGNASALCVDHVEREGASWRLVMGSTENAMYLYYLDETDMVGIYETDYVGHLRTMQVITKRGDGVYVPDPE